MSRLQQIFAISCLTPVLMLADFSNDVAYIAEECFTMCHFDALRVTNSCQTEIARVMALPENERLNMTAILDAKIAAIEAAEAHAARRAAWNRRLRIGGYVLLPVIGLATTITILLRRKRGKR